MAARPSSGALRGAGLVGWRKPRFLGGPRLAKGKLPLEQVSRGNALFRGNELDPPSACWGAHLARMTGDRDAHLAGATVYLNVIPKRNAT